MSPLSSIQTSWPRYRMRMRLLAFLAAWASGIDCRMIRTTASAHALKVSCGPIGGVSMRGAIYRGGLDTEEPARGDQAGGSGWALQGSPMRRSQQNVWVVDEGKVRYFGPFFGPLIEVISGPFGDSNGFHMSSFSDPPT